MEYLKQITALFEFRLLLLIILWKITVIVFYKAYKNRSNKYLIAASIIFVVSVGNSVSIFKSFQTIPRILLSSPGNNLAIPAESPDIRIIFSMPVVYDKLIIHTNPPLEKTVKKNGYFWNLLPFGTSLTIVPRSTLPPGERLMIYLVDIKGIFTKGNGGEKLLEMQTDDPVVESITPPNNTENVAPSQEFIVRISSRINDIKEWTMQSDPTNSFSFEQVDDKTLRIKPDEPFRQGTSYNLILSQSPIIFSRSDKKIISQLDAKIKAEIKMSVVKPVYISSFVPDSNSANPQDPIVITFDEPMDSETFSDKIRIDPNVSFKSTWNDEKNKHTITSGELKKDTKYTVTIYKGIKTEKRGILESDAVYSFKTAGPLTLLESVPKDGNTNTTVDSVIKLTFDQKVPDSIKDQISINPEIEGNYSVKDNVVEFKPKSNLRYEAQYAVRISDGAPSVYGLPAAAEKTISFSTQLDQVLLQVPYFRQQTLFTCNIASARMLLAYRGVSVTEQDLISKIGYQARRGSGNPHKGYVDNFGTFWEAISKSVSAYRGNRILPSGKLNEILQEVKKGNPVMTWGQNGWSNPYDISWTASDGTFIKAVNGMHSVVVTGYTGSIENPQQIFVNDPWRGQYSMSKSLFLKRWSYYKMAMVVE